MQQRGAVDPGGGGGGQIRSTVVGVFEDNLDTEQALATLRKAHVPADRVSVLVRDPDAADNSPAEAAIEVARAIAATALEAMGNWLHGLAALIVPERGTFLVAGPLGAALAGISAAHERAATALTGSAPASTAALDNVLQEFGFGPEEAAYLESRLTAGAPLVAVTAVDANELSRVRQIFADNNAVHIGMAQTDARIVDEAQALLAAPPEVASGGDVVVTDAVAPLRKLCGEGDATAWSAELCGRAVVDAVGAEVGAIDDLLVDAVPYPAAPAPGRAALRYVIVAYGGMLGLGRHRVAVPPGEIDLNTVPARLMVAKDVVHHAPGYDASSPFSRREEQAVCAYFGCTPYWLAEEHR